MLSRIASHVAVRWSAVGASVAALGVGAALVCQTGAPAVANIADEPMPLAAPACAPHLEAVRATAVIHFMDEAATTSDPLAYGPLLLALPTPCQASDYAYPALTRYFVDASTTYAFVRDFDSAERLIAMARTYGAHERDIDEAEAGVRNFRFAGVRRCGGVR